MLFRSSRISTFPEPSVNRRLPGPVSSLTQPQQSGVGPTFEGDHLGAWLPASMQRRSRWVCGDTHLGAMGWPLGIRWNPKVCVPATQRIRRRSLARRQCRGRRMDALHACNREARSCESRRRPLPGTPTRLGFTTSQGTRPNNESRGQDFSPQPQSLLHR